MSPTTATARRPLARDARLVAQMNLGLSLDFGGKWMTPEQIDTMRRVIVKAT